MTRTEFQSIESYMTTLDAFLSDPVMKIALEIVHAEAMQDLPSPIPGVSYGEMVAAHGARATGWVRGLKALTSLSRKIIQQKQPSQEDMYTEAAAERMRASKLYTESEIKELL